MYENFKEVRDCIFILPQWIVYFPMESEHFVTAMLLIYTSFIDVGNDPWDKLCPFLAIEETDTCGDEVT